MRIWKPFALGMLATFALFGIISLGAQTITTGGLSLNNTWTGVNLFGLIDSLTETTTTTGTTATLNAYQSGLWVNEEATAGQAVTYTLPAGTQGMIKCVENYIVSGTGAPDTGILTVYPQASSYIVYKGVINTIGGGGTHGIASGGAAADMACFHAVDSTHWNVTAQSGTWTPN